MSWFSTNNDSKSDKALGLLQNRVDKLYEGLGQAKQLESKIEALQGAWERERLSLTELYDKAYHMLQRHAKRDRDAAKSDPPEPENGQGILDVVSDRVNKRRNGGVSPVLPR